MESVVQCCIHGEKMNEPIRTLPCLHSACLTCLKQYCASKLGNDMENRKVKCPKCHDQFEVPASSAGGVESMPTNDFTASAVSAANTTFNPNKVMCEVCEESAASSRCKDCSQWSCESCRKLHLKIKVTSHHQFVTLEEAFKEGSTVLKTRVTHCQKHKHLEINAFCNSDNTAVCSECVVEGHKGHDFDKLANVAMGFKESVSSIVAKVKNSHSGLVPAMAEIDKSLKAVNDQAKKATDEIHKVCDELREYANEREKQLKNEVEEIKKEKEKALIEQKRGMEILEVGIRESSAMAETMLKEGSETEIVASQKQVITRFTKLEEERKKVLVEPATDISLDFDEGGMREAKERIMKIGSVVSKDISSEKSSVERQQQDQGGSIILNQRYSFKVIVVDKKGNRVGKGKGSNSIPFTVGITAGNQLQQASVSAVDGKEGEYSVSFTPTQVGGHDVSVCHKGKHFKGSPFRIEVVDKPKQPFSRDYGGVGDQPVLRFGSQGSNDGQFSNPRGLACTARGDIVVCEYNNHRIQVFEKTGKFLFKFGSNGNGNGQFKNPSGVTVDHQRNNQIVVADSNNNRVQIFDEKGVFIRLFGSKGNGDGQLNGPSGILVDPQGNYLVADQNNHRVQIFDSNGRFVRKFGSSGNGNGQFSSPKGIGLLSNGNIVVVDDDNSRVQIFDSTGNFIRIIGVGQLKNPEHLFVDSDDNILVADYDNNRIQVFKADGTLVKTIGTGQISYPLGICMDGEGRILVSENNASRVSVF